MIAADWAALSSLISENIIVGSIFIGAMLLMLLIVNRGFDYLFMKSKRK